jgi:hypothetical protein
MLADQLILGLAVAVVLCGAGAWWWAMRQQNRRFDARLQRAVTGLRRQHEAVVDKLTAAHEVEKKALEGQRNSSSRHVVSEEQRAAMSRLEDRLSAAYTELDRLRLQVNGPAPQGKGKEAGGFATTEILERPAAARPTRVQRPAAEPAPAHGFAATMPFDPDL